MIGIILLGKSNSGKSTIGKAIANKYGIRYISSGDIARDMDGIGDIINSGELAPEDKMRGAIVGSIMACNISFILDGFPRFMDQYKWINDTFTIDLIYIYVDVSDKDVILRARLRNRDDDNSIFKKLEYFKEHTKPMICEILNNEDAHIIDNGSDTSIEDNINKLGKIIEEYGIYAHNSQI